MRELIPGLTLDIDTDRLTARIALVANIEGVDATTIVAALEGEGIARASLDEDEIAAAVARARAGEASEAVVAQGSPVHHGRDARVDIEPALAEQLDRQRAVLSKTAGDAERAKVCDEADVSHYEVNALCVVAPGQRIGRELDAEPGEDGLDIFGKVIGAREGREIALKLDGVARDGAGVITAKHAGLLLIDPTHVTVSKELRLPGAVDFTTGHVRFPGDAEIADGVRDNFKVEVGGTLTVRC
ncbi:MAG: flagellar assembly protein A, partial [Planctomycetota bacterium]